MKFIKLAVLCVTICAVCVGGTAWGSAADDVTKMMELQAKLTPGLDFETLKGMLGDPAEKYAMDKKAAGVKRYMWMHGEMGVEIYCIEDNAYKVNITLPCGDSKEALKAMDAITRQGQTKYRTMPRFDNGTAEYYWISNGLRIGFSKYDTTTVRTTCVKAR